MIDCTSLHLMASKRWDISGMKEWCAKIIRNKDKFLTNKYILKNGQKKEKQGRISNNVCEVFIVL